MQAAVVTTFDQAPRCQEYAVPEPSGANQVLIEVLAAGLHPRVRSQAQGTHYASSRKLPLVPGIDGVGRTADGRLHYFVLPDTPMGSMAERTVIDVRRSIELPPDCDPVEVAAGMNPAMSAWIALRRRIEFEPGQRVIVLGATGSAGRLAVQVAKSLGAGHVTAAGRDPDRLAALTSLGADDTVALSGEAATVAAELGTAGRDADVVLDYLWGRPTADALRAIVPRRADDTQRLSWIQVGSVAGVESPIPSAALRAIRLEIIGSGQGSVSARGMLAELPQLIAEITRGAFAISAKAVPLHAVEQAWADARASMERIVLTP